MEHKNKCRQILTSPPYLIKFISLIILKNKPNKMYKSSKDGIVLREYPLDQLIKGTLPHLIDFFKIIC